MAKEKTSFFKRGFRGYYILVVSIILLTIAIQSIIQYSLNKQRNTALVVNLAGQQSTRSQKVLNEMYSCYYHNCNYAELKLTVSKLLQMNRILKEGSDNLSIDAVEDPNILANFKKLEPQLEWFEKNLNDLGNIQNVSFDEARNQTDSFSVIMDKIVGQFQRQSEEHVKGMMIVEAELAIFSVIIVLFEIFFIVNPIINRILDQKQRLTQIAWHQSHAFDVHMKNVKDMQYVLKMEKNPERQQEIVKFIIEEMDGLKVVSDNMQKALEKNEKGELPGEVFMQKVDSFLGRNKKKVDQPSIKPKTIRDGKVRSAKWRKHDKTVPQ